MRNRLRISAAVTLSFLGGGLFVFGCTGDSDSNVAANVHAGGDASASPDGGTTVDAARPLGYAYIYLIGELRLIGQIRPQSLVVTSIAERNGVTAKAGCSTAVSGGCTVTRCPPTGAGGTPPTDAGLAPPAQFPSVGNVIWTGAFENYFDGGGVPFVLTDPAFPVTASGRGAQTMTPDPLEIRHEQWAMSLLFRGEEAVHVEVEGGTIPGFTDDLTLPLGLIMKTPRPEDGEVAIQRGSDTLLAWQRGVPGVKFLLRGGGDLATGGRGDFICQFPSELGSGMIPKDTFKDFTTFETIAATFAERKRVIGGYEVSTGLTFLVLDEQRQFLRFTLR